MILLLNCFGFPLIARQICLECCFLICHCLICTCQRQRYCFCYSHYIWLSICTWKSREVSEQSGSLNCKRMFLQRKLGILKIPSHKHVMNCKKCHYEINGERYQLYFTDTVGEPLNKIEMEIRIFSGSLKFA